MDEPLVWYEGAGAGDRRWLIADQLGSVVAVSNASGAALAVNSYDEYGTPGPANLGRFGYTGQAWLPEAQLYHYRARAYAPNLGRFLQADPIGFGGGMNLYAYVGNDPVNWRDPWGLVECDVGVPSGCDIFVTIGRGGRPGGGGGGSGGGDGSGIEMRLFLSAQDEGGAGGGLQTAPEDCDARCRRECVRGPRGYFCNDRPRTIDEFFRDLYHNDPCGGDRVTYDSARRTQNTLAWITWGSGGLSLLHPLLGVPGVVSGGAYLLNQGDVDRAGRNYNSCMTRNGVDW